MKLPIALTFTTILTGCAATIPFVVEGEPTYDEQAHARIRVRSHMDLHLGDACESYVFGVGTVVRSAGKVVKVPTAPTYISKQIGMPMPTTKPPAFRFHEIVLEAGKPLVLSSTLIHNQSTMTFRCGPVSGKFVPEAGKNYEADSYFTNGAKGCNLVVEEIISDGEQIFTVPVKLQRLQSTPVLGDHSPQCAFLTIK